METLRSKLQEKGDGSELVWDKVPDVNWSLCGSQLLDELTGLTVHQMLTTQEFVNCWCRNHYFNVSVCKYLACGGSNRTLIFMWTSEDSYC